jgi:hypothetical protein
VIVTESILHCAIFIGADTVNKQTGVEQRKVAGTAFIVAKAVDGADAMCLYCVTAKHNLKAIEAAGGYKVLLRVNMKDVGATWIETEFSQWHYHPDDDTVDVAVCSFAAGAENDQRAFDLKYVADAQLRQELAIGVGDEVFTVGLFSRHYGRQRNLPILRTGNIAAMPQEHVYCEGWGDMKAYLVESRSIKGLSGSPVFVHPGLIRPIHGRLAQPNVVHYYLLGLMHGHWDAMDSDLDFLGDSDDGRRQTVNMGIAIVVPVEDVLAVLNQPKLQKKDAADAAAFRAVGL